MYFPLCLLLTPKLFHLCCNILKWGYFTWVTLIYVDSSAFQTWRQEKETNWQRYLYTNFQLRNDSFQILTSEDTINFSDLIKQMVKSHTSGRVLVIHAGGLYDFQQSGLKRFRLTTRFKIQFLLWMVFSCSLLFVIFLIQNGDIIIYFEEVLGDFVNHPTSCWLVFSPPQLIYERDH